MLFLYMHTLSIPFKRLKFILWINRVPVLIILGQLYCHELIAKISS
jgi:hypothetical protein